MNLAGQKFGKYELIESLGQGGMAEVYKAHQPGLDRFVAIKVMHRHLAQSPNFVFRFKREAKSIGQLQHPHILHVIDFDVENDTYYLVMDYIPGDTLEAYLQAKGALSVAEALALMAQLADAVDYAHQRGMIHRDIKPANVMFLDETCSHTLLNDFGMARLQDDTRLTATGAVVGTPAYMSPEAVMSQEVDERADIYSLGIMMYEMLTGTLPFEADTTFAMMIKITSESLPSPRELRPDLSEAVETLLLKALAKDKTQRIQSAAELKAMIAQIQTRGDTSPDLPNLLGDQPTIQTNTPTLADFQPTQVIPPTETISAPRTPPWLLWAGLAGLVVVILGGIFLLFGRDGMDGTDVTTGLLPESEGATVGLFRFQAGAALTSDFTLQLDQLSPPPAGSHYALWLRDGSGAESLNLVGQLPVENGRVLFTGSTEQNLLNRYSQALITVEPDGQAALEISANIAYRGTLAAEQLAALRQIIFDDTRNGVGLLASIQRELEIVVSHAGFIQSAIEADDFVDMKQHAEHVVNILDGESGPNFGDYTGDEQAQNPGDGFGIRGYLAGAEKQTALLSADPAQLDERDRLQNTISNNTALVDEAIKKTLQILATDTTTEAQPLAAELASILNQVTAGTDLDGNGVIDPTQDEGGTSALFDLVLPLAEIDMFAVAERE